MAAEKNGKASLIDRLERMDDGFTFEAEQAAAGSSKRRWASERAITCADAREAVLRLLAIEGAFLQHGRSVDQVLIDLDEAAAMKKLDSIEGMGINAVIADLPDEPCPVCYGHNLERQCSCCIICEREVCECDAPDECEEAK